MSEIDRLVNKTENVSMASAIDFGGWENYIQIKQSLRYFIDLQLTDTLVGQRSLMDFLWVRIINMDISSDLVMLLHHISLIFGNQLFLGNRCFGDYLLLTVLFY